MSGVPEDVLRRIVAAYDPERVILFGSRARGDARPDSDYDLAVVLGDEVPSGRLRRRSFDGDAQVLPWRVGDLRSRAHIRGAFAATILREGRIIFVREGATPLTPTNDPNHTPATEAVEWLEHADEHLDVARLVLARDPPRVRTGASHVQQAAEKLIKALLILADREVPRTHDLGMLLRMLGAAAAIDAPVATVLPELTGWATAGRYPKARDDPTPDAVAAALPIVERLRENVAARIAAA